MAVDSSPEDEEFHDAREHLEGSQQAQQAQQGAAAGAALPPGALHLRTQPDEVQWTNLHDLEPAESLPETQVDAAAPAVLLPPPAGSQCCPSTSHLQQHGKLPRGAEHRGLLGSNPRSLLASLLSRRRHVPAALGPCRLSMRTELPWLCQAPKNLPSCRCSSQSSPQSSQWSSPQSSRSSR